MRSQVVSVASDNAEDEIGETGDVGLIASNVLAESDSDADDNAVGELPAVAEETAHGAVGMIRKSSRDERRKRSAAYDHTEPYKMVVDQSGVEFEVRSCKYCDAVFSLKGGTTSATLRHLKSTHPQEFFEGSAATTADSSVAVGGEDPPQQEECLEQEGELEVRELPTPKPLESSSTSNKRRRYDDDYVSGKPTRLTSNQQAIVHFLDHYRSMMDSRLRLAFVKHLTYNDREAEMYNVLDDETRLEYVTQFANQQIQAEADSSGM